MSEDPVVFHDDMGLQKTLGYITHVYADRTELHLDVDERHLNRAGLLHGGIFCVLLDSACGYAASRSLSEDASQRVVTLTLNTSYLAPGHPGTIHTIARVTGGGSKTLFTEGKVVDAEGKILATATAVMRRISGRF